MKVVHIITGLQDGGAEAVLYRLCERDRSNDHLVISLSGVGKYGPMLEAIGVKVISLDVSLGWSAVIPFLKLVKLVRQHKPSVIQTWMYHADLFGGLAARIAGVRAVVWGVHHTTLKRGKSKKMTIVIAKLLARWSWWLPAKIAVCAQRSVDVHYLLGYDKTKMSFIPNGYGLSEFRPRLDPPLDLASYIDAGQALPVIGMVGRFDPQKDHTNLLDALVILRNQGFSFKCLLVGTGLVPSNLEIIKSLEARDLISCVKLLGSRNDVPNIMNALDLHVLSSAYGEAFPNVVCEAMACGTPCVVTDVGDAAYIVGDTGWVVPPNDSNALAEAIAAALCALTDPSEFNKRKLCARRRVEENFDIERMVNSYSTLWKQAINDSHA